MTLAEPCASCGRQLRRQYPGGGYQDVDGFVQCRPRGQQYAPASMNPESPDGHHRIDP